ncbi:MAG: PKD domain-containing protein [Thermoplasmata archaeon]|nr:PKD domain-containing protein [Thermoplasmata archaeon]
MGTVFAAADDNLAPMFRDVRSPLARRATWTLALLAVLVFGGMALVHHDAAQLVRSPVAFASSSETHAAPRASFSLSSNGLDPTAVSLSWDHTNDLVFGSYEVDLSTNGSSGPWQAIANVTNPNSTEFGEPHLSPGTTDWFRVIDYQGLLGSTTSNVLAVQQPVLPSLTSSNLTSSSVDLSWTNPATYGGEIHFSDYQLNESASGGAYATVATIPNVSTVSYRVTGLSPQTGYSFQVAVVDTCCGGTALRASSNVVTVGTPELLGASAIADPTTTDAGQRISFTCSATGGIPPYGYLWDFGNGSVSSSSSTSYAFSAAGLYSVTCKVSDASGATAHASLLEQVRPAPNLTVLASHGSAAPGSVLNFTAQPSGGTGTFVSLDWSFGDGGTAAGSHVSHAYAVARNYTVSVTAQDTSGGSAHGAIAVVVQPVTVVIVAPALSGQSSVPFQFSASAAGGAGGPYTIAWNFGDKNQGVGSSVSHAYSTPGSYTVSAVATDPLGATGSGSAPSLLVYDTIRASITSSSSNPMPGAIVSLTAQVSGGSGNYSCVWSLGGSTTLSGCTVQHSWAEAGRYSVGLVVTDSRAGNASVHSVLVVGTPTTPPGSSAHPASVHYWVLGLLVIPAILLLWGLTRRRRTSPAAGGGAPASPDPGPAPSGSVCGSCGTPLRPWMMSCPGCEEPLPGSGPLASPVPVSPTERSARPPESSQPRHPGSVRTS